MENAKKHAVHGFTQYELTNNLLNNLSQFDITPTAKLVLLYLSSCYNPKKADMFPKQKTIALKLGISERSTVRAIQELFKAGLIMIECKHTNRYKFTSKIVSERSQNEKIFNNENLSETKRQIRTNQNDKKSPHVHEQTKETNKEPMSVENYKILKDYAVKNGAKSVQGYINALIKNGSAESIIREHRAIENNKKYREELTKQTIEQYRQYAQESEPPCAAWKELGKRLRGE